MSWKGTAFVKEIRSGLTVTEKFVLLMLGEYHHSESRSTWPSIQTIAQDCLMTERAVQGILSRLEQKEFIKRDLGGGRGRTTAYKIVGLDCKKGELETVITGSPINKDIGQKGERNPEPSGNKPCTAMQRNKERTGLTGGTVNNTPPTPPQAGGIKKRDLQKVEREIRNRSGAWIGLSMAAREEKINSICASFGIPPEVYWGKEPQRAIG